MRSNIGIAVALACASVAGCVLDLDGRLTLQPDVQDVTPTDMEDTIVPDVPFDPLEDDPGHDVPPVDATDGVEEPDLPPCDGPMVVYYVDADGDTFGDIGGGIEWCAPPPGFVENHDDCYDSNADAFPGQGGFFPVHRGDGSFDYDCDLSFTYQYMQETACDWGWCEGEGWTTGIPACGVVGNWRRCDWWVVWCEIQESARTQGCR